ncbi:phage tail protein [Sphingopyxis sp. QXT-31]|uniref:phage tail protein n=1 Tax=Sphingopyxis sp. QXT-31 TaxID=1357916 RepID=UPI0018DC4A44|nr:tail fiber protein [Sphingopyxis sp. QXT-31]
MTVLRSSIFISASAVAISCASLTSPAAAQDNYLGQILKLGGNFCPIGTLRADGSLLSIAQESTLYTLYGTTYGGDGVTTFALPDLRGRTSMGQGQGPGLTSRVIGERAGTETNLMTIANMPRHEHTALVRTTSAVGDSKAAFRNLFGTTPANKYVSGTAPYAQLINRETLIIRNTGGDQPWDHRPPTLAVTFCVVNAGIFPSQN